jgi:hypothetical protein
MPRARLLTPNVECMGPERVVIAGRHAMPPGPEVAVDKGVRKQKSLSLPPRFESLHLSFPASRRLMRVLRAIIEVPALAVLDVRQHLALGGAVALPLVGDDYARHKLQASWQSLEEPLGGLAIAPALNQNVEHDAVLIDGAPEIVLHALDADEYRVRMPAVPRPRPQLRGKAPAELVTPAALS